MSTPAKLRRRALLVILDGFGLNPGKANNAVVEARTPRLDEYFSTHSHTTLEASGSAVGLPSGQMGNSEVGHITIGCGCIIRQDLVRIDQAIYDGSFFENPTFRYAVKKARDSKRPLHLIGLVSDGGVHSHINHLLAIIRLCKMQGVSPLVHMITDGRDTGPRVARRYLPVLEEALSEAGGGIATVMGRYYAMDRDKRWHRTQKAWEALVQLKGERVASARNAIESAYAAGKGDEFILPAILPTAEPIDTDDCVLFFNFRNDRPRQLVKALSVRDFDNFERGDFHPVNVVTMTEYDAEYPCPIAFLPERPAVNLGQIVSEAGLRQFHCAETEKYPHVTFFLNGGRETPYEGEDRTMVPSPKVATYDLEPEMSAATVADNVIEALRNPDYALVVVNFANGDMVGHTAVRDAVIKAVEVLDTEVGRVLDAAVANDVSVLLTADHGNCDEMVDALTGEPHTQHTLYPVPCLIIDKACWRLSTGAGISSVTPTILQFMGLPQPPEMTARSLLLEKLGT